MSALGNDGPPIDRLLSRLEGVRETSTGQYMARCPAHDDGSPSLAIRDVGDSVLIHCFAGCDAESIMAAVDLSLADLFVRQNHGGGDAEDAGHGGHHNGGALPIRERWNAPAMLRELSDESVVVLIAAADMLQNRPLPPDDYKRLRTAVDRISRIVEISA